MDKLDWKLLGLRLRSYKRTLSLIQWREDELMDEFVGCVEHLVTYAEKINMAGSALALMHEVLAVAHYESWGKECELMHPCDMRRYPDNELVMLYPGLAYRIAYAILPYTDQIIYDDIDMVLRLMAKQLRLPEQIRPVQVAVLCEEIPF